MFKNLIIYDAKWVAFSLILLSLYTPVNAAEDFSFDTCSKPPVRAFEISDGGLSLPFIRLAHARVRTSVLPSRKCTWLITIEKGQIGLLRLYLPNGKSVLIKNTEIRGTIAYRKGVVISSHITAELGKPVGGAVTLIQKYDNQRKKNIIELGMYNGDLFEVLNILLNNNLSTGSVPFEMAIVAAIGSGIESVEIRGTLKNVSFEDQNFENAAENLKINISANARFSDGGWKVEGKVDCAKGDLFAEGYFLDFTSLPLTVNFKFLYGDNHLPDGTAMISFGNVASLHLSNESSALRWRFNIPNLERLVKQPILSVVETAIPGIRKLETRGSFQAKGLYTYGSRSGCLKGTMECSDCSIVSKKVRSRFDMDLPIYLNTFSKNSNCRDETIKGKIVLKEISIGDLYLDHQNVPITASLNTWQFNDSIRLRLPWGELVVRKGRFEIFPEPRGFMKLDISDSLKFEFTHQDFAHPLALEVESASIDVLYEKNKLEISPELNLRIFSGRVTVDRLLIEDPLSPSRSLVMDAHWKGIDLEELSRLASFGIIKGKLSGEVKELRIAYGFPVIFDLKLISEPAKEQTISVLAVRNITQIGSSGNPFQGITGTVMTTLFKEFPYDRIGIGCTLRNDKFSLRGLIKEGNTEYLIIKRGIRGINVINRQSPNVISWNEMIRRLKRIERAESAKTEGSEQ